MKSVKDRRSKLLSPIYYGLIMCCVLTGLAIVTGTIYGVFFNVDSVEHTRGIPGQKNAVLPKQGGGQTFTGIGQVRVSTSDPQPMTVILFVTFIYYPDDKAFSEELALKVNDFRDMIADYIGSFSGVELRNHDEEKIKAELLRRFNAALRLGQIGVLFFSDFMIVG